MALWRVQRYLAAAGLGSRRSCEALVAAGRVKVDGQPAALGTKVDPDSSRVEVDGQPVELPSRKYYLALNKPLGYVVTKSDPEKRNTVMALLSSLPYSNLLNPVGRLDMDTEGLLLLTNDGDLAHRLTHPSYEVKKTYEAVIGKCPTAQQLEALRRGFLLDGRMTAPTEVRLMGSGEEKDKRGRILFGGGQVRRSRQSNASRSRSEPSSSRHVVRLTIHEGRKRQVRRMFQHLGLPVLNLRRISIGPLSLGRLKKGAYRALTPKEVLELRRSAGLEA